MGLAGPVSTERPVFIYPVSFLPAVPVQHGGLHGSSRFFSCFSPRLPAADFCQQEPDAAVIFPAGKLEALSMTDAAGHGALDVDTLVSSASYPVRLQLLLGGMAGRVAVIACSALSCFWGFCWAHRP